ncbi:MAG: hypothetical protein SF069_13155 [Phycisphaerae bacterium]|nr:hypothetical protein [Phycisphaerae bacterium]
MKLTPETAARLLTILLRLIGGVMLLATLAVAMPTKWMAWTHTQIGLGDLPRGPIVEYLTRSLSALYAVHGAVLLMLAMDVRRYRAVIAGVGGLHAAFGLTTVWIDWVAGMPMWWTANEGGPVAVVGGVIFWLARQIGEPRNDSPDR